MTLSALVVSLTINLALPGQDIAGFLALDRGLGESVVRNGLAAALRTVSSDQALLLYPGAPVVVGKQRIETLLAAQPGLDSLVLHWRPRDGWLSRRGDFGAAYGTLQATTAGITRVGTYLICWRLEAGAWRLVGLQLSGEAAPGPAVLPNDHSPRELPPLPPTGPAAAMIQADLEFAAMAARAGAPEAFAAFAAAEAVVGSDGLLRRGPEAIRAGLAARPPADWVWAPVAAHLAADGDLGFTVGQAVIRPREGGEPSYSKYLTVWRRDADGRIRFLTDAGNARPR
jgi:ketosteroid isomerase-like protein